MQAGGRNGSSPQRICIRCRRESNWAIYGAGRPEVSPALWPERGPPAPAVPRLPGPAPARGLCGPLPGRAPPSPLRGPVEAAPALRPPRAAGSLVEPTVRASPGPCRVRPFFYFSPLRVCFPPWALGRAPRFGEPRRGLRSRPPAPRRGASWGPRKQPTWRGRHLCTTGPRGARRLPVCATQLYIEVPAGCPPAAPPGPPAHLDVVRLCTASFPSGSRRGSGQ